MADHFYPGGGHHYNGSPFGDYSSYQPYTASPYTNSDDQSHLHTIDFSASQAYFNGLSQAQSGPSHAHFGGSPTAHFGGSPQGYFNGFPQASFGMAESSRSSNPSHSPHAAHSFHAYSPQDRTTARSPESGISGLDPVSNFGFASSCSFARNQHDFNGYNDATSYQSPPAFNGMPPNYMPEHAQAAFSPPAFAPISFERPHLPQLRSSSSQIHQQREDAAHRSAEVERRNKLRGEEKERREVAIQKQVDDGMAALHLEKDEAAHRTAEVEPRNKQREVEKEQRRLAIKKQVEDGIKAIRLEKERERARVEADRIACRKWLSDLQPSQTSSSAVDVYAALGRQLRGFWQDSRPAPSRQTHRDEVIADVQRAINRKWPGQGLKVAAFGSSVTGLVTESSDLDLVLLDPTRPFGVGTPSELCIQPNSFVRHSSGMPEWYSIHQVASAIKTSGKFRNVVSISGASVPIVKMIHRKYDIPSDININERFGLFNSQLICAYADLQPDLVRPLIFFLKHWYSRRELNDPAGKRGSMTFSSYTITLMALQVLQIEGLLPNLQSPDLLKGLNVKPSYLYSRPKRPRRRGNWRQEPSSEATTPSQKYDVTFASGQLDSEQYRKKAIEVSNGDTLATSKGDQASSTDHVLGKMLAAFVRFYADLDRRSQVVSVVNGAPLQRKRSSQPRHVLFDSASEDEDEVNGLHQEPPIGSERTASRDADGRAALRAEHSDVWEGEELVVQDPFIIDRNTSRNIKVGSIERWQGEMDRAIHLLGLDRLDKEPTVEKEKVPLVLDLCIPQTVLDDLEAAARQQAAEGTATAAGSSSDEPWRIEEEAAALEKEIARQAAEALRKEKKKKARRATRHNARLLQEEAGMVEDMIDGIETGRVTGLMNGDGRHEIWRLRTDDSSNGQAQPPIPFTFSVARSPKKPAVPAKTPDDATRSPTPSVDTSKTDGSSSSEDIDLVALRLKQNALKVEA